MLGLAYNDLMGLKLKLDGSYIESRFTDESYSLSNELRDSVPWLTTCAVLTLDGASGQATEQSMHPKGKTYF